jgi:GT2 family glycosyltransferase
MLCLLNDDVYPVTSDWLESMVLQAERPDVGVVGALLLYPDGTIQHAGVAWADGIPPLTWVVSESNRPTGHGCGSLGM